MKRKMSSERKENYMSKFFTRKRIVILLIVIVLGILLGRFVLRAFMNILLGGTMFGGNFL